MRRRGFTLIELLVVISLLGVLMGLTVGLISRSGTGNLLLQGANKVSSLLSMARNASVGNSQAFVSLEPQQDGTLQVRAYRFRQVFAWACEDMDRASELDRLKASGTIDITGEGLPSREGHHAQFAAGARITLGAPAWLQMTDGFSLECRINPSAEGSGSMLLFDKARSYSVRLMRTGPKTFDVEADLRLTQAGKESLGGKITLRTGFRAGAEVPEWRGPVSAGRWQDLKISYDRSQFVIQVDGLTRAIRTDLTAPLQSARNVDFIIGGGYMGGFDSLVISGIFGDDDDVFEIAPIVNFVDAEDKLKTKGERIHFRNRGLDPRRHSKPVEIILRKEDDGVHRVVHVTMSGEIFVRRIDE